MLKSLAVIAVIFAIAQAPVLVSGQAANDTPQAGGKVKQEDQTSKTPAQPPTTLADQNQPAAADGKAAKKSDQNQPDPITVCKLPTVSISKDWADWSYWGFSGLLVAVGGLQAWLLRLTWRTIKRQVAIQEAGMQQWVEVRNWRVAEDTAFEDPRGSIDPPRKRLRLEVDIVNGSKLPLTITDCGFAIQGTEIPCSFRISRPFYLTPKTPIVPVVHMVINESQFILYITGRLTFKVEGDLSYIGVLKRPKRQPLDGVLGCSPTRTSFDILMVPEGSEDEKPN